MNFFSKPIFLLASVLLLCSCEFSENIVVNPDGTGSFSVDFDGSALMEMAGEETGETAIDSVLHFKDFLTSEAADSLSTEDLAKYKKLENFSMHMLMDPAQKKMVYKLFANFNNVGELQDMLNSMASISDMNTSSEEEEVDNSNPFSAFGDMNISETKYSYEKSKFTRKSVIKNQEKYQKLMDSISTGNMSMMYESTTYKLNYTFPKKIKKVSNEAVTISEDGKNMVLELSFMDYLSNPAALDVEVEFEK